MTTPPAPSTNTTQSVIMEVEAPSSGKQQKSAEKQQPQQQQQAEPAEAKLRAQLEELAAQRRKVEARLDELAPRRGPWVCVSRFTVAATPHAQAFVIHMSDSRVHMCMCVFQSHAQGRGRMNGDRAGGPRGAAGTGPAAAGTRGPRRMPQQPWSRAAPGGGGGRRGERQADRRFRGHGDRLGSPTAAATGRGDARPALTTRAGRFADRRDARRPFNSRPSVRCTCHTLSLTPPVPHHSPWSCFLRWHSFAPVWSLPQPLHVMLLLALHPARVCAPLSWWRLHQLGASDLATMIMTPTAAVATTMVAMAAWRMAKRQTRVVMTWTLARTVSLSAVALARRHSAVQPCLHPLLVPAASATRRG